MSRFGNFFHTEAKYGVLNQSDFDQIFEKLHTLKSSTQEYSALAELHRDFHSLLAGVGQVSTEYSKTQYLLQALQNDPAGKYAIEIFLRTFPAIPDRTFERRPSRDSHSSCTNIHSHDFRSRLLQCYDHYWHFVYHGSSFGRRSIRAAYFEASNGIVRFE